MNAEGTGEAAKSNNGSVPRHARSCRKTSIARKQMPDSFLRVQAEGGAENRAEFEAAGFYNKWT